MIQITPTIFRGPRPLSLALLRQQGITLVIDLQSGAENLLTDTPYEFEDPDDFGMQVINFKWSNIWPPTAYQVLAFLSVMHISRDKNIYIHCHSGVDRTGFAAAIIRMRLCGFAFKTAHDEFVSMGRHWWFWWWKYELKKWEKK